MAKADQRKPKKFSQNPARRHHYIPVFYLNSWARNNGQLVEFSKPHEKVIDRFRYPKATGFLNDLYTIRELPLELQTWLEEYALRQIDDLAASSYQVFLKGVVPTTEALRSSWSRFILSLIHRSPESLERLKLGYYREVEKNQGESEKAYLASRGENDPETYEEALKKFAPHSRARLFAKLFTDLIDNEYLGTRLNRMFWQVIVFQNRPHLLTSDRPIVMTNGFAYHDSHICLALSPTSPDNSSGVTGMGQAGDTM